MRTNSGKGKSSTNRGNPTLEEHQQARGKSGESITGAKKRAATPSRTRARSNAGKE